MCRVVKGFNIFSLKRLPKVHTRLYRKAKIKNESSHTGSQETAVKGLTGGHRPAVTVFLLKPLLVNVIN